MARNVDIAITTWPVSLDRLTYLCSTIDSLRSNLRGAGDGKWYCNAESESRGAVGFTAELEEVCGIADVNLQWHDPPANLGNNLNHLLDRCESEYIFVAQDDRELNTILDLKPALDLLESYPKISAVWYDWLPYGNSSWGKCSEFWLSSPTSTWIIADREMLIRRTFLQRYGHYLEDSPHGEAEMDMNRRLKRVCAMVAHPQRLYFDHLGEVRSVEST